MNRNGCALWKRRKELWMKTHQSLVNGLIWEQRGLTTQQGNKKYCPWLSWIIDFSSQHYICLLLLHRSAFLARPRKNIFAYSENLVLFFFFEGYFSFSHSHFPGGRLNICQRLSTSFVEFWCLMNIEMLNFWVYIFWLRLNIWKKVCGNEIIKLMQNRKPFLCFQTRIKFEQFFSFKMCFFIDNLNFWFQYYSSRQLIFYKIVKLALRT